MLYIEDGRIYLTRGDDAVLAVSLKDADGNDYTMQDGDTLTLTVRRTPADDDVVLETTSTAARLTIAHADTADQAIGEYSADVQLTSGGKRTTVWPELSGRARATEANFKNFIIMPEVTRE